MTDRVKPSYQTTARSHQIAGTIQHTEDKRIGHIRHADNPSELSVRDNNIDEQQLVAFSEQHSDASLDVTINGGEAFIYGAWVSRDEDTVVSLEPNEDTQTVYVGWDIEAGNTIIVGLESDFNELDPKIQLYEFDTDTNGVTHVNNVRDIGKEVGTHPTNGPIRRELDDTDRMVIEENESMMVLDYFDEGAGDFTVKGDMFIHDFDEEFIQRTEFDSTVDEINAYIEAVEAAFETHETSFEAHGSDGNIVGQNTLDAEIDALNADVDDLQTQINSANNDISDLEDRASSLESRMDSAENTLDDHEQRISDLESE